MTNSFGLLREIKPLCLFDLFVYPHYRGLGEGRDLLERVLELEGKQARQLALEKPTKEVLQFVERVFGLRDQVYPPANGFVVFNDFFEESRVERQFANTLTKTRIREQVDQVQSKQTNRR